MKAHAAVEIDIDPDGVHCGNKCVCRWCIDNKYESLKMVCDLQADDHAYLLIIDEPTVVVGKAHLARTQRTKYCLEHEIKEQP